MDSNNLTPIQTLIASASSRIRMLKESEFTPQAELAQLELLLANTLCVLTLAEYIAPLQLPKKG